MPTTDSLPSVPAGFCWKIKNKRQWKYLALCRKTWYGWKAIDTRSLNPAGLGMQYALRTTAEDIAAHRWGHW